MISAFRRRLLSACPHIALILLSAHQIGVVVSQYLAFRFYTNDVGNLDYMLYHTLHGDFFYSIVTECPHFALHFTPSLALLVPLYALVRHVLFLPILEAAALMSGAWAVAWLFAGLRLRARCRGFALTPLGLCLGFLFIANPFVGSMLLANHFESLAVASGLWALAALANGRKTLFWALLLLTLGFKEDLGLYWIGFGAWWFFFGWPGRPGLYHWRRRFPQGGTILLLCGIALAAALITIARVGPPPGIWAEGYAPRYNWLGDDWPSRIGRVLTTPRFFLLPLQTAWLVLYSTWFLWLAAPSVLLLLVLPGCVMGFSGLDSMHQLYYYYSYPFLPFVFLGICLGMARICRMLKRRLRRIYRTGLIECAICVAAIAAGTWQISQPTRTDGMYRRCLRPTERHRSMRMALRTMIPREASVAAQFDLLCQIPHRRQMLPLSKENIERAQYWAIDQRGFLGDINSMELAEILSHARRLVEQGEGRIVIQQDGFLIFQRLDAP